jgi:signal transduction histidine kinase/ligand-binding sensor domain-containing protein/CheY-like chemotaxis protein
MIKIKRLILFGVLLTAYSANAQRSIFTNFSLDEGLVQSSVLSIFQDSNANIWFGTQGGLSKYNGRTFKTYDTRHGLADNHISSILQDSKKRYWFGHRYKGISLMYNNQISIISLTDNRITVIKEDMSGNIWFGTEENGIYILPSGKSEKIENFIHLQSDTADYPSQVNDIIFLKNNTALVGAGNGMFLIEFYRNQVTKVTHTKSITPNNEIFSIAIDNQGDLWFMGESGISKAGINDFPEMKEIEVYNFEKPLNIIFLNNIVVDKENTVWGTTQNGIFSFKNGKFKYFSSKTGFPKQEIYKALVDREGNVWFGTLNNGAYRYSGDRFTIVDKQTGLSDNMITSITEDQAGNMWISTQNGLNRYNGDNYKVYTTNDGLPINQVDMLFTDSKGYLWIGFFGGGLIQLDPKTDRMRHFTEKDGLITTSVISIAEDKNGDIWFATLGIGVSKYSYPKDGKPEKIETFTEKDGLCSNNLWTIHSDNSGNIWFGSDNFGLTKYDGEKFTTYNEKDGLTDLSVGAICNDKYNNIWIASIGSGIFKFDGNEFKNYSINEGLSSDNPFSIICDDNGYVWVGTNTGVDRFDPVNESFKHYGKSDGFLGIENNQNAVCKTKDGKIWFGTINGVVILDPSKDFTNIIPPVISLENIQLYNSRFDYGKYAKTIDLNTFLPVDLRLPYNKNHLTFNFIGISLIAPEKVRYQYMLENFDDNWNPPTTATQATYTNIPPGDYTFKVKACNNDDIWSENAMAISFTVLPPFWMTWWFISIAILFVITIIYSAYWFRVRTIRIKNIELERLVDEKTGEIKKEIIERKKAQEKAEEADRLKTAFLANMSHEIRTPLNAIIGFSELLKDNDLEDDDKNLYIKHITSSGKSLLNLINDIIDISKIEAGQLNITKEDCAVNSILYELYATFQTELKRLGKKDVELKLDLAFKPDDFVFQSDPFRLQQVITNLLSNACKFTDKGFIEFGYRPESNDKLLFFVKDTGTGIPIDKQKIVFERFRQVADKNSAKRKGTGLGLAISKKLINLLGGDIWLDSLPGEGSTFYFTIPLDSRIPQKKIEEFVKNKDDSDISFENKTIMIVEDEESNFVLLETILKKHNANILYAKNGKVAVDYIRKNGRAIDLIMMDILMPEMDGYEATRLIKELKNEIPVIAHTAYTMETEKDKCIASGCDYYISKPCDVNELLRIIKKFIGE